MQGNYIPTPSNKNILKNSNSETDDETLLKKPDKNVFNFFICTKIVLWKSKIAKKSGG